MELIVVMILTGILAATVVPRLNISGIEESGFFSELLSAIRFAQKIAVASGCYVQVQVDAANDKYTALKSDTCIADADYNTPVANPGGYSGGNLEGSAPDDIELDAATITFDKIGRATGSVGVPIKVVGAATRRIQVEAETGFAREI